MRNPAADAGRQHSVTWIGAPAALWFVCRWSCPGIRENTFAAASSPAFRAWAATRGDGRWLATDTGAMDALCTRRRRVVDCCAGVRLEPNPLDQSLIKSRFEFSKGETRGKTRYARN